jgi:hypothetical protein
VPIDWSALMDTRMRLAELRRTTMLPRPLTTSRPRDVQLTAAGRGLVIMAVALGVGALGALVGLSSVAYRQADQARALVEEGVTTPGEVARLWASGDDRRRVNYRFVANGHVHEGRVRVSDEHRRALHVGSALSVRYVPADPNINDLGGAPRDGMPIIMPYLVACAMVSGSGLCLMAIRRQRQLLTDGRAAPALVTGHAQHRTSRGGKHRSLTYSFPLLSGAVASGKSATTRTPPAVGSVIWVIYDPEAPTRHRVYPLSLVTPVS